MMKLFPLLLIYNLALAIYGVILSLLAPLFFVLNSFRGEIEKNHYLFSRWGFQRVQRADIWIHALSGGEVAVSRFLIRQYSQVKIVLTTSTYTGMEMAKKLYSNNRNIQILFAPLDFLYVAHRWCKLISPKLFITIEHDLWPNLLHVMQKNKIQRVVVNGWLKKGDKKVLRMFPFVAPLIYNVDTLFVQDNENFESFKKIVSKNVKIINAGNLKYCVEADIGDIDAEIPIAPVVVFGSTHKGEDNLLFNVELPPRSVIVLIPRHPDRVEQVKADLLESGKFEPNSVFIFSKLLYGTSFSIPSGCRVLIVDKMGYSLFFYSIADLVLIGDTFLPTKGGGHNILEPLIFGVPVLYGPYLTAYSDVTPKLEGSGSTQRIDALSVSSVVGELMKQKQVLSKMGESGKNILMSCRFDFTELDYIFKTAR